MLYQKISIKSSIVRYTSLIVNASSVKSKGQNYVELNLIGKLLMEQRDGKLEYKLLNGWNKILAKIGKRIGYPL